MYCLIHITGIADLNDDNLSKACGILIQYPDGNGDLIPDLVDLINSSAAKRCLVIAASDLLACTLITPPGQIGRGADIVVGSAQRFGIQPSYGGPHAAFMACRHQLTRLMPGRLVGVTKDANGGRALRLALQTREQHIRRDKATSNICTAQALLANMSAMYAVYHGPDGLRKIASSINEKTVYLANYITSHSSGNAIVNKLSFDTLKIRVADPSAICDRAEKLKINLRYFPDGSHVGLSLDETVTDKDLNDLCWIFTDDNGVDGFSDAVSSVSHGYSLAHLSSHPSLIYHRIGLKSMLKRCCIDVSSSLYNIAISDRYTKCLCVQRCDDDAM